MLSLSYESIRLQIAAPTTMHRIATSHWNPFRRLELGGIVEESYGPDHAPQGSKSKTWETTVERVPSWPEEARPLKKHTWITYLYGFGDLVLVTLPIFFIRRYRTTKITTHLTRCSSRHCSRHAEWQAYRKFRIWQESRICYGSRKDHRAPISRYF